MRTLTSILLFVVVAWLPMARLENLELESILAENPETRSLCMQLIQVGLLLSVGCFVLDTD